MKTWLLAALAAVTPASALAWGHLQEFNHERGQVYLIHDALGRGEILYCLDTANPAREFPPARMARQLEAAIGLWLDAAGPALKGKVRVRKVGCANPKLDLKLTIGSERDFPELTSFEYELHDTEGGDRWYSLIRINTDATNWALGVEYPVRDFESVLGELDWKRALRQTKSELLDVSEFAERAGVPYHRMFWTTYRILIHEVGHAFGLCDTRWPLVNEACDPKFLSERQPSSVMKDSDYLYLTEDDVAGMRALVERFRTRRAGSSSGAAQQRSAPSSAISP